MFSFLVFYYSCYLKVFGMRVTASQLEKNAAMALHELEASYKNAEMSEIYDLAEEYFKTFWKKQSDLVNDVYDYLSNIEKYCKEEINNFNKHV